MSERERVVVVGGGLAGLAAATCAARAGARVTLLEAVGHLGGRARTRREAGLPFNMGPHALYAAGAGMGVLRELGVDPDGWTPPLAGSLARDGGRLHPLPVGFVSLLTTGLLGAGEKLALGRLLAGFARRDTAADRGRPLDAVLEAEMPHPRVRALLRALVRLSTYAHAPDRLCAGAAFAQLQLAQSSGVRYLRGGWQPMVDALAGAAREAGVELRAGARVRAVEHEGAVRALRLAGDERVPASRVVLALGPAEASALVDAGAHPGLREHAERAVPARAACLDLGLDRLPDPRRRFALGVDEPTYFSVHSPEEVVAAGQPVVVHVARYLAPGEKPERTRLEEEFDTLLDGLQPGWRERVVARRLLVDARVSHGIPTAERGGLAGRPGPRVDGIRGLLRAGDWVGPEGLIADAALASGRAAGWLAAGRA